MNFKLFIFTFLIIQLCFLPSFAQIDESQSEMVFIKGGNTKIGFAEGLENEKPSFNTIIASFMLDTKPVTVAEFRKFIKLSRYITDAEKSGQAAVLDSITNQWQMVKGADWQYPFGKNKAQASANEPVKQISWNDAKAYSVWVGKRLPSEFEMEYAFKQAENLKILFGNGTLWQWCENWYAPYNDTTYYSKRLNREKTLKGGIASKYLAENTSFRPSMRMSASAEKSFSNVGFRCAKDLD